MEKKMITLTIVHKAKNQQEYEEFLKSLSFSHSEESEYEVIANQDSTLFEEKNIRRVDKPSPNSSINITLPDDCLVLGSHWDKYIKYALDNGLPQHGYGKNFVPSWEGLIQHRLGLQSRRPPEGIFPDLKVELATQ